MTDEFRRHVLNELSRVVPLTEGGFELADADRLLQGVGRVLGFTWEDVDRQNARAEELEILVMHEEARPWRDLATRLASILPPRT